MNEEDFYDDEFIEDEDQLDPDCIEWQHAKSGGWCNNCLQLGATL